MTKPLKNDNNNKYFPAFYIYIKLYPQNKPMTYA